MVAKRVLVFALELLIVAVAVIAGSYVAQSVRIIPKALLHLPDIAFSVQDTLTVLTAFLVACAATFAANGLLNGWEVFGSARRAAKEVYALLIGIVAAALYLFFLTAISFSPELLLDASLIAFALFLISFAAFKGKVGALLSSVFGLLRSPWVWPILLFAMSPIVVARQFTTDRDFANWVTNVRVAANVGSDHRYTLVNALGSVRFETPIDAKFAKGDPGRVYVLTRGGKLFRLDYPSGANKILLLDIAARVGYVEMENGALGFDLHPGFADADSKGAGQAFVYFTEYHPDRQVNHLTRYTITAGDPAAVAATALPLITQGRNNDGYHNGGSVNFGPDGFLYLSVGEMSMTDCHQRLDCALAGGILRLDVDQRGGAISHPIQRQPKRGQTANYFVPLDNPYARDPASLGEFWAHGLRNPFRISFDPVGGQLWAGEVGSTTWEEVNRIGRGTNHQFPFVEGRTAQPNFPRPDTVKGPDTPPTLTYRHTAYLRSVIGGAVYRGTKMADLSGQYLFGDNYSGEIMAIPADSRRTDRWTVVARARDVAQRGLTSFTVAPDGELLVTVMGDNDKPTGTLSKLVLSDSDAAKAQKAANRAQASQPKPAITIAQAKSLYAVNCARCHGISGKADGPDSKALGEYVPDLTNPNFQTYFTDAAIIQVIAKGGEGIGRSPMMPPWEGVLTPAEIVAMKDHVRRMGKAEK